MMKIRMMTRMGIIFCEVARCFQQVTGFRLSCFSECHAEQARFFEIPVEDARGDEDADAAQERCVDEILDDEMPRQRETDDGGKEFEKQSESGIRHSRRSVSETASGWSINASTLAAKVTVCGSDTCCSNADRSRHRE